MMKKIFLIIILFFYIFFSKVKVSFEDEKREIKVSVSGHINNPGVFKLDLGSNYSDLLAQLSLKEDSNINIKSLNEILKNNEVIIIPRINEDKVSINKANIKQLCNLNGIGEYIASNIVEYRNNNGGFKSLEEIKNVKGIGDKLYEKIKDYITI